MTKELLGVCLISAMLFSCRASRPAATTSKPSGSAEDYIQTYKDLAMSEMKRTGVPASITLAQGLVESGMGKGDLAVSANNHFGIKCHDNWDGPTVRHDDDRRNECFRKYKNPAESFRDHSDFLKNTPRYAFLFDLKPDDYKGWAKGLKKAGYATNPDYAGMLIANIEKYGLYRYDDPKTLKKQETVSTPAESSTSDNIVLKDERPVKNGNSISYLALPDRVMENNRIQYIIVNEHDTRERIEKELNLLKWELAKYNELNNDFTLTPGQMLYLQPKRDKAEAGKETYVVKEGDTMYLISQAFGIKLKKLYEMNRMEEGSEPSPGQKLWLRSIRPVD